MTKQDKPPTFDQKVCDAATIWANQICKDTPELRSVAVLFDWEGRLNDSTEAGVWLDDDGPIQPPQLGTVRGMFEQTLKLLQQQQEMLHAAHVALIRQIGDRQRALQELETRNEAAQSTANLLQQRIGRLRGEFTLGTSQQESLERAVELLGASLNAEDDETELGAVVSARELIQDVLSPAEAQAESSP